MLGSGVNLAHAFNEAIENFNRYQDGFLAQARSGEPPELGSDLWIILKDYLNLLEACCMAHPPLLMKIVQIRMKYNELERLSGRLPEIPDSSTQRDTPSSTSDASSPSPTSFSPDFAAAHLRKPPFMYPPTSHAAAAAAAVTSSTPFTMSSTPSYNHLSQAYRTTTPPLFPPLNPQYFPGAPVPGMFPNMFPTSPLFFPQRTLSPDWFLKYSQGLNVGSPSPVPEPDSARTPSSCSNIAPSPSDSAVSTDD